MRHNNHTSNKITTSLTTSRISTRHSNDNRREGVVETSDAEEEEDLAEGDVRLLYINVYNQVTMLEIA